jgi:hypothetical protein
MVNAAADADRRRLALAMTAAITSWRLHHSPAAGKCRRGDRLISGAATAPIVGHAGLGMDADPDVIR